MLFGGTHIKKQEVDSHTRDKCSGERTATRAGGWSQEAGVRLRPQGWKGEGELGRQAGGGPRVRGLGWRHPGKEQPANARLKPVRHPGAWPCLTCGHGSAISDGRGRPGAPPPHQACVGPLPRRVLGWAGLGTRAPHLLACHHRARGQ